MAPTSLRYCVTHFRGPNLGVRGTVFDIQRFSLHDGPGIRTTVFLKGCPLRCFWCQNPEGLRVEAELRFTPAYCVACRACADACPNGAHRFAGGGHEVNRAVCQVCGRCAEVCPGQALVLTARRLAAGEVVAAVLEDEPYYRVSGGGVTLSGGEPLLQPEFAEAILAGCKARGIYTALDTSLYAPWDALEKVLPHTDLVLADLKHLDDAAHRRATGQGNRLILENLKRVVACRARRLATESGGRVIVRVPVVPTVNDSEEAIGAIAAFVADLGGVERLELIPYHRLGEAKRAQLGLGPGSDLAPLGRQRLDALARCAARAGVAVRGVSAAGSEAGAAERAGAAAATYAARIEALRRTKLRHTALKRCEGPRDVDDWGQIPLGDEPFAFTPTTDHPRGYVLGPRDCGRNFRRFLEACPTYVDPTSSLLGGYYVTFNGFVTRWDPDAHWSHLEPEIRKYGIIHGIDATQHFLSDVAVGLDLGLGGLLEKIERYRRINRGPDQQAYYDGLTEFVRGVQGWIGRHADAARRMAASEPDPLLRANLLEMAAMNERLVSAPPATFREACQWLAWYQMAKRSYIGGGPLGRLDQILYPYYQRDRAAGRLSDEDAVFDLACLLVKDSHYIQLGGVDPQGRDVTNPLSLLFLEAAERLRIPANLAVVVHDGMDERLLDRAVRLLLVGRMGVPRFAGHKALVEGLVRGGLPPEVARQRVQAGCHWFCLPGLEYSFNDVIKINFAKVLEVAFEEMMDDRAAPPSVAGLWDRFERHLGRAVEVVAQGIDYHMEHQHRFYPELALSLLCHGPVEKGVDASHGSLPYTNIGVDGAALATVADAFAAMERRIEREGLVTWTALRGALGRSWRRAGRVRLLMQTVPGYGRGETRGQAWAERISRCFADLVVAKPTPAGHRMLPGLFSWASVLEMGRQTGATPDGRAAGEPLSFGANPIPGRLHGGPLAATALSTAVARVQPGWGNPAPLQLDFDPGSVADDEDVGRLAALFRTHFDLGGTLINANVLDREAVLEACKDPSKYPDLMVRVTGFSAYFASLSDEFRRLIYERIVAMEG